MKNIIGKGVEKLAVVALLSVLMWGCQDDNAVKFTTEKARVQSTVTASDQNDIIDVTQSAIEITSGVFANEGISSGRAPSSGRISGGSHNDDWGCRPSISGSFNLEKNADSLVYSGTITIDYGDGSSCNSTRVRKGKITDTFKYVVVFMDDSISYSSKETITFEGFIKDSTQVDGTFIITSSSGKPKTVEAKDAKITYPDGTSVQWSGVLSFTYDRGERCKWKDNTISVTGSISGVNREGVAFTLAITDAVVYKYKCNNHKFNPVAGVVEVTVGGILSVIDFGDGDCDRIYTITVNGETTEHKFGGGQDNDDDEDDDEDDDDDDD